MVEKIATLYRKAQIGIASGLAGTTGDVINEAGFYDVGYMQTQVNRTREELKRVTDSLKAQIESGGGPDSGKEYKAKLMDQRERLLFRMVFLASNSPANFGDCMKMAEGHGFAFMRCVEALAAYSRGNHEEAFRGLEAYYKQHGSVDGHFLANKVFGLLLAEKGQGKKAIPFLTYALQFMPDDRECLECLMRCYQKTGRQERGLVISGILSVLG